MADESLPLFADAGKFYTYIIYDSRPRKHREPIYVGKGCRDRADVHWREGTHNPILRAKFAKIRAVGLEPIVHIEFRSDDDAAVFACERKLIAKFGRRDLGKGTLCNLTDGGEGSSGLVQTHETVAKRVAARRGRKLYTMIPVPRN